MPRWPFGGAANCAGSPERTAWLEALPTTLRELQLRWSLTLGRPFDGTEVSAAWVAPVERPDGSQAVLKLSMPHLEAEHEIDGLRFWKGDPTVRLLDADDVLKALLLERCTPGTVLRSMPEVDQDVRLASALGSRYRKLFPTQQNSQSQIERTLAP